MHIFISFYEISSCTLVHRRWTSHIQYIITRKHTYTQTRQRTHAQTHAICTYISSSLFRVSSLGRRIFTPSPCPVHVWPLFGPGSGLDRYVWTDEKKANEREKKTRQVHLIRIFFLTVRICTRNCYKWSFSSLPRVQFIRKVSHMDHNNNYAGHQWIFIYKNTLK